MVTKSQKANFAVKSVYEESSLLRIKRSNIDAAITKYQNKSYDENHNAAFLII
jgi:hypothetical protein